MLIQKEKAKMQGIKLKCKFKPQDPDKIISMFNTREEEIYQNAKGDEIDYETWDSKHNRFFEYIDFNHKLDAEEQLIVKTDKRRLQQVLINLQSNALKFSEQGDQVTLYYSLYVQNNKSYVELQVKDTGCGIKKADKKKLFKLFGFI